MRTGPRRSLCPPRDAASPSRLIPLPHFPTILYPFLPNRTIRPLKNPALLTPTPTPHHTSQSAWKTQKPFPLYGRGVLFFLLREGRLRAKRGRLSPGSHFWFPWSPPSNHWQHNHTPAHPKSPVFAESGAQEKLAAPVGALKPSVHGG